MAENDEWKLVKPAPKPAAAANGDWKKVADPGFMDQHPQFAQDVSDLGALAKGVVKSGASTVDLITKGGDWLEERAKQYLPGPLGFSSKFLIPGAGLGAIIPEDFKQKIGEFAGSENKSPAESAGYYGGELGQILAGPGVAKTAGTLGKTALKGAAAIAYEELTWHTAKYIADKTGTPVWPVWAALQGPLAALGIRHLFRGKTSPAVKKEMEEAKTAYEGAGAKEAPKAGDAPAEKIPEKTPEKTPPQEPPPEPQKRTTKLPGVFPWNQ